MLPMQDAVITDRERATIPIPPPQLIGATPDESGIDKDSDYGPHIRSLVGRTDNVWHDDGSQEVLRREAVQFWARSPETQSWYHEDDTTGEKIWAPVDLD